MNTSTKVGSLLRGRGPWRVAALCGGLFLTASCADAIIPLMTTWEGSLEALAPAGPRGSLAVLSQSGRAQTSLQLTRGQTGATYAWRILSGSCSTPGDIVGGLAAYPRLTPDEEGSSTGQTTLSRELEPEGAYAGWIYLESAGGEAPVACGELLRTR